MRNTKERVSLATMRVFFAILKAGLSFPFPTKIVRLGGLQIKILVAPLDPI